MKVRARFFALFHEMLGKQAAEFEVEEGATVRSFIDRVSKTYPQIAAFTGSDSMMIAVNSQYTDHETRLSEGDEVAFIPPVSGGSDVSDHD